MGFRCCWGLGHQGEGIRMKRLLRCCSWVTWRIWTGCSWKLTSFKSWTSLLNPPSFASSSTLYSPWTQMRYAWDHRGSFCHGRRRRPYWDGRWLRRDWGVGQWVHRCIFWEISWRGWCRWCSWRRFRLASRSFMHSVRGESFYVYKIQIICLILLYFTLFCAFRSIIDLAGIFNGGKAFILLLVTIGSNF